MGRRPSHNARVDMIIQFLQALTVFINDSDIVFLIGQSFSEGAAHLIGTKDNNFHGLCVV